MGDLDRAQGDRASSPLAPDANVEFAHLDAHQRGDQGVTQFVDYDAGQNQAEIDDQCDLSVLGEQESNALYVLGDPSCQQDERAKQDQKRPEHIASLSHWWRHVGG